jgi:hypothetical protein
MRDICVFVYLGLLFNLSNVTCCILFTKYHFADVAVFCFSSLTRSPKNRRTGSKRETNRKARNTPNNVSSKAVRRVRGIFFFIFRVRSTCSCLFSIFLNLHPLCNYVLLSIKRKHKCHYLRYNVKYKDYEDYLSRYRQA